MAYVAPSSGEGREGLNSSLAEIARNKEEKDLSAEQKIQSAVMRVVDSCLEVKSKGDETSGQKLVQLLEEFVVVVKRRLLFSPRLEYLYASQLKSVQTKAKFGDALNILDIKFHSAQEFRAETLNSHEKIIEAIDKQLKRLEADSHEQIVEIRSKSIQDLDRLEATSKHYKEKLEQELQEKEDIKLQIEQNHLQIEIELREKRKSIEGEILSTIKQYDSSMEDFQRSRKSIAAEEEKTVMKLLRKQIGFQILEGKYTAIEEERAREEERKLAAIQEEFHREHSARVIQKAWSHYKMKKMLKKAHRKGKRKKTAVKEPKNKADKG